MLRCGDGGTTWGLRLPGRRFAIPKTVKSRESLLQPLIKRLRCFNYFDGDLILYSFLSRENFKCKAMSKSFGDSGHPRDSSPTDRPSGTPTLGATENGNEGKAPIINRVGDILGAGK